MIGPAIGGSLILLLDLQTTLWINGGFFILAALLLMKIADKENLDLKSAPKLTLKQVIDDFGVVKHFMKQNLYVSAIYLGFIFVMVATFAMDAQEIVFTQQVIGLSETEYSLLISITGIGSVAGGVILSFLSNNFSLRFMISIGILLSSIGYVIYALSWSFISITVGFVVLGFFLVFLNAGITTFYQNNVQLDLMGRVTSIIQLVQSAAQVLLVLVVGFLGDILSLRITIIGLSLSMLILSFIFVYFVNETKYNYLYKDTA
ncbi:MFS transporter [Piscibacillus salipiscarius]|nr:MFS transporter [Piscibacillus salipiscarius]